MLGDARDRVPVQADMAHSHQLGAESFGLGLTYGAIHSSALFFLHREQEGGEIAIRRVEEARLGAERWSGSKSLEESEDGLPGRASTHANNPK